MNQTSTTPLDGTGGKNPPKDSTAKKPRERKRRNYAKELAEAKRLMDMARRALNAAVKSSIPEVQAALCNMALDCLEGETE